MGYVARLADKRMIGDQFCLVQMELVKPPVFRFRAGQWVEVARGDEVVKRYFASSPDVNHGMQFLERMDGTGLESWSEGDEVKLGEPQGDFFVAEKEREQSLVFVAVGEGIAPIRSMILDQVIVKGETRKMRLLWGLDKVTDMFWEEDFYQLAEEHDNFEFDLVLENPPRVNWKLSIGHVQDLLAVYVTEWKETGFYLSAGIDAGRELKSLIESRGEGKAMVHEALSV